MTAFSFETAPRIVCEPGSSANMAQHLRALGVRHAFIVTDRMLHDRGLIAPVVQGLRAAEIDCTVFSDVQADPPQDCVMAAVRAARDACADGVVGFGGGSSMDAAKLVALLARSGEALETLYGVGLAKGPRWPLLQVPTTAGTGSEVTPIAIVTTPTQEKKGVVSPVLYPDLALLDARLTLELPPRVTAMTGVDAMVHAIEAYTTKQRKNPISDALAQRALTLLYGNLRTVLEAPHDLGAREAMLLGSLLAGMAFANAPVAAVHALAYPIGGLFHVPHGLSNSLVLAPVLRFNRQHAMSGYAALARTIGVATTETADVAAADAFVDAIAALVAAMPYEQRLRELGVQESDLPRLAEDAMNVQRLLVNNPREVTREDALALYREAF